jgi:hypothetical protein
MKAIGLGRHTRALAGLPLATTVTNTLWVSGKEIAAGLNTITTGTATTTATSATMTMIEIATMTTTATTIAAETTDKHPRRRQPVKPECE